MVLELRSITQPEQWTQFLQQHPYNYFLQTWQWSEFQNQGLGKPVYRLGFYDNEKLVGLALAIVETTRFGQFVYIPRGPVIDWSNSQLVSQALSALINFFARKNYFQLRLEPLVLLAQSEVVKQLTEFGFRTAIKAIQVELAWVLDLNQTEADLLKNMRQNRSIKNYKLVINYLNFTEFAGLKKISLNYLISFLSIPLLSAKKPIGQPRVNIILRF